MQGVVEPSDIITEIPICLESQTYTIVIYSSDVCTSCYYQLINPSEKKVVFEGTYNTEEEKKEFELLPDNSNLKFNLYPNPTNKLITIEASYSGVYENAVYSIYNLDGGLITNEHELNERTTIDITELEPGYYIVEVNSDYGKFSMKFLKL